MTALAVWQYGPRGETEIVHLASSGEPRHPLYLRRDLDLERAI